MGSRYYACAISGISILKKDKVRVIIGNSSITNLLLTGQHYAELQSLSGASLPAVITEDEELELNYDLMSDADLTLYIDTFCKDKYVSSIPELLDSIESKYDNKKRSNKTYTIILEDVYQLLVKDLYTRENNGLENKTIQEVKKELSDLLDSDDRKITLKENEKELEEFKKEFYEKRTTRTRYSQYDNFDDFYEDNPRCKLDFIDQDVLSFFVDKLEIRGAYDIGYLLDNRTILNILLEDIAFKNGLDCQNIILTPVLLTSKINTAEQVDFQKGILELKEKVLLNKENQI